MIAKERGRGITTILFTLAVVAVGGSQPALAQSGIGGLLGRGKGNRPADSAPAKAQVPPQGQAKPQDPAKLVMERIPVNPTDAIAVINGEPISRRDLADECVARKGKEILDTLIARKLIEQALKKNKLEVTPAEVDAEIDRIGMQIAGLGREAWLKTLDKERGISPIQYARDIIYPALALRKLAGPRVQVTEKDLRDSFEAQYGDKLRVRMIMVDKLPIAREIWEQLRDNPGGFEKIAQERSMDTGSRSLGGLLAEPITRHAFPQNVSDAAFRQLVDGDPNDKDATHKPKDGDMTGPIQVAEATWIILRRESVLPGQKVDPKDERVRKQTYDMIYEVKLKEAMGDYFVDLMKAASIQNDLTGQTKLANEEKEYPTDNAVKLMGNSVTSTPGKTKLPAPAAASREVINQVEKLTTKSAPASAPAAKK